jgi:hypothetical protein
MEHRLPLPSEAPRMAPLGRLPLFAVAQLALMGGLAWTWLASAGARPGLLEALICTAPVVLALRLGFTSQADRQQYVARLLACAAMLPILLMMWAGAQDTPAATAEAAPWVRRPWIFFAAFALLHAAVFVAAVAWLARAVTRVEAARRAMPVPAPVLVQRLRSLAAAGVPFTLAADAKPGEWVATLRLAEGARSHRVLLEIDEPGRTVRVRERLGASGAAPCSCEEASLRTLGEPICDPTRPQAQKVSSRVAQATMIDPEQLEATRLVLQDGRAEPAPQAAGATAEDPDAVITLLCALVTRSGYAWQPLLGLG